MTKRAISRVRFRHQNEADAKTSSHLYCVLARVALSLHGTAQRAYFNKLCMPIIYNDAKNKRIITIWLIYGADRACQMQR